MTPKVASPSSISESIAYCRKALPLTSRTFALGIELLKDPLRDEIGVAYLICRVLDTIEDTTSLPANSRSVSFAITSTAYVFSACSRQSIARPKSWVLSTYAKRTSRWPKPGVA